jgi:hypothetical protein
MPWYLLLVSCFSQNHRHAANHAGRGARCSLYSQRYFVLNELYHGTRTYRQCVCMSENGTITYGTRMRRFHKIFFFGSNRNVLAVIVPVSNENVN